MDNDSMTEKTPRSGAPRPTRRRKRLSADDQARLKQSMERNEEALRRLAKL